MASASRLICCTGLDCSSEANSSTSRCLSSREISSRFRAVSASACSSCARSSSVASPMSSSGWAASSAASSSAKLTVSFSSAPSGPSCLTDADSSPAVAGTAGASATAVRPPLSVTFFTSSASPTCSSGTGMLVFSVAIFKDFIRYFARHYSGNLQKYFFFAKNSKTERRIGRRSSFFRRLPPTGRVGANIPAGPACDTFFSLHLHLRN